MRHIAPQNIIVAKDGEPDEWAPLEIGAVPNIVNISDAEAAAAGALVEAMMSRGDR